MKPTLYMNPVAEADVRKLRQAIAEARAPLGDAAEELRAVLGDEFFMAETPLEVQAVMESAVEVIGEALRWLDSAAPAKKSSAAPPPGGPTCQQGQFLAFIREYIMRNETGVAPSHAEFMRFFNLTAGPARTAWIHPTHSRESAGNRTHHQPRLDSAARPAFPVLTP
jgi:hypothetical protein